MAAPPCTPRMAAAVARDEALVASKRLHPECAAFVTPAQTSTPQGVVLMLHGFTAGPWQYRSIARKLAQLGHASYAARLPGHGATAQSGGEFESAAFPKSSQSAQFAACAEEALGAAHEWAQHLGVPLYLVGFSAGGALGADLLQRFPQHIERAVLIAPLLRPHGRTRRIFFRTVARLPWAGRVLDRIPFAWKPSPPRSDGWVRPGHARFHLGNVGALFAYAHKLKALRTPWQVPTQFILTAIDDKVDPKACRRAALRDGHAVWWFAPGERVPHAMLSAPENANPKSLATVERIVCQFVHHGVGQHSGPA